MYKKILIGGVTAAAIIGAGGTAMAVSGSNSTPATSTGSSSTSNSTNHGSTSAKHDGKHAGKHKGKHAFGVALRRLEHGQFVTRTKDGTVTHDLIRGTVTAVSATSITVASLDSTSEIYVVTKDTKIRVRDNGKGAARSISDVHTNDQVMVAGTGTSKLTAKHIVDVKGAKTHVKK